MNESLRSRLNRVQSAALVVGVAGLALCVLGAFVSGRQQFFASYLFGYLFWLNLSLGCFGIAMLQHLTGGRWGFVIRRFLEAGFMIIPLMALLFVPLLFGLQDLYAWARPTEVAVDPVLQNRANYLNPTGFIIRAVVVFAIWSSMAWCLRKWSLQQDQTTDPAPTRRLRTLSGPGMVIYPLTATFAYIDWAMSLEPDWYSTMFPVIIVIGQFLSTIAFSIVMLGLLRKEAPFAEVVSTTHFHHLGNLLLTFVMFWTYISFGQFLIIWSGNLPQEIVWYVHRIADGWKWIVVLLALFHFFVPFFLLLFRANKQRVPVLMTIAGFVFFVRILDVFWMVAPSFHPTGIRIHWLDVAAPLGVGGIWIAAFIYHLKRRDLLPRHDPRLQPVIAHAR
ncbi:MAG: hypothetical protein JWR69_3255 [Pedosphaera sp.]|nr:hypothetical protein [Pedosphaera sp.]